MSRTAVKIVLDVPERELLQKIHRKRTVPEFVKDRLRVVLAASEGRRNDEISARHGLEVHFIGRWRNRWARRYQSWQQTDETLRAVFNEALVTGWLADDPGRGRKATFTAEQKTKVAALSLETPEQCSLPVTHWTTGLLAEEAVRREIAKSISASTVSRILKKRPVAASKPILAECENR